MFSDNTPRLPTPEELDELLGKPGPPIEIDAETMAACVQASREETMSQNTTACPRCGGKGYLDYLESNYTVLTVQCSCLAGFAWAAAKKIGTHDQQ